jgi:hypothetical protein
VSDDNRGSGGREVDSAVRCKHWKRKKEGACEYVMLVDIACEVEASGMLFRSLM